MITLSYHYFSGNDPKTLSRHYFFHKMMQKRYRTTIFCLKWCENVITPYLLGKMFGKRYRTNTSWANGGITLWHYLWGNDVIEPVIFWYRCCEMISCFSQIVRQVNFATKNIRNLGNNNFALYNLWRFQQIIKNIWPDETSQSIITTRWFNTDYNEEKRAKSKSHFRLLLYEVCRWMIRPEKIPPKLLRSFFI